MKKNFMMLTLTTLATVLTLTSCTQHKTSAERNARHFIYASNDGFDPSFVVNKADSARIMEPFFKQFWDMGVQDKATGISRAEAEKRITQFHDEEFLTSVTGKSMFAGKSYTNTRASSPKYRKALAEAISDTYLDGYEGRN